MAGRIRTFGGVVGMLVGAGACSTAEPTGACNGVLAIINAVGATGFSPDPQTVAAGQSVCWQNNTGTGHAIVANAGAFGGPLPSSGAFSHLFTTAGTFPYHCSIHPNMTGTLVVR